MRLALRVLALNVVLVAASLVFAEEVILTGLILVAIALSIVVMVRDRYGLGEYSQSDSARPAKDRRG